MTDEQLQIIANLTVELTRLRQHHCPNLCIENFAPKLFGDLVREYNRPEAEVTASAERFRVDYLGLQGG